MLERLEWMTLKPKRILDVDCRAGHGSKGLRQRYPEAQIIALDAAYPMLEFMREQEIMVTPVCADAENLPLPDNSVDLVFANLVLSWCPDLKKLLHEWRRVLRPEGLLVLTAFGPDTLQEWQKVFAGKTLPALIDLHDLGDALLTEKFSGPVLDMEYITLTYQRAEDLLRELQLTGMIAAGEYENSFAESVPLTEEGLLPVTYEIVYGHAFGRGDCSGPYS